MLVVTCVAGSDEYTNVNENMFPAQEVISRISKYTEKVYVTSIASSNPEGYESLNGTIIIISNVDGIVVNCTNNDTILKETDWFKENRVWG